MRALVLAFSMALLTTATPAQADTDSDRLVGLDMGEVRDGWVDLCSYIDLHDEAPCLLQTCTLPNEDFPEIPDEPLPVVVNVSQCRKDVEELLPGTPVTPVIVTAEVG